MEAVWRWLDTAFHTYVLHLAHGNGYQWTSGPVIVFGLIWNAVLLTLKHNCYEHGCPRIARVQGEDGHMRCKRCDKLAHPERYGARRDP